MTDEIHPPEPPAFREDANLTPGTDEKRQSLYSSLKDQLYLDKRSNIEQADKTILTLSSALLALSVAFLKDIIGDKPARLTWALGLCWLGLSLAILCTLLSFYTGRRAIDAKRSSAYRYYIQREKDAINESNPMLVLTEVLNSASGVAFFVALVFGAVFIWQNLPRP